MFNSIFCVVGDDRNSGYRNDLDGARDGGSNFATKGKVGEVQGIKRNSTTTLFKRAIRGVFVSRSLPKLPKDASQRSSRHVIL